MGVRFIAPQSKAAEFIDNQLNKVIHLITGDDTEYSVIAAQVRTEPMEDKTDLINSQKDKNTDKNIKSIVYSSDLGYDDERDGKVSDLSLIHIFIPLITLTYVLPTLAGLASVGQWESWTTESGGIGYSTILTDNLGAVFGVIFMIVAIIGQCSIFNVCLATGSRLSLIHIWNFVRYSLIIWI